MTQEFIYWLTGIMISSLAAGFGITFLFINRKGAVQALARATKRDAEDLAKVLSKETKEIANEERSRMEEYIDNKIALVEKDIESLNKVIKIQEENLTFLKQFMWGTTTKSDPPYLSGEIETESHHELEGEGIFKDTEQEKEEREHKHEGNSS